jgi:hypothetical protein
MRSASCGMGQINRHEVLLDTSLGMPLSSRAVSLKLLYGCHFTAAIMAS